MFVTTEAYDQMATLRIEVHLNANAFPRVGAKGWKCTVHAVPVFSDYDSIFYAQNEKLLLIKNKK